MQVIKTLNIKGPVVLVGAETGTYDMRKLASMLVEDGEHKCAGLLLVDPSEEHIRTKHIQEIPQASAFYKQKLLQLKSNSRMSYFGFPRLVSIIEYKENEKLYPTEILKYARYGRSNAKSFQTAYQHYRDLDVTEKDLQKTCHSIANGTYPCIFLTIDSPPVSLQMKYYLDATSKNLFEKNKKIWEEGQEQLYRLYNHSGRIAIRRKIPQRTGSMLLSQPEEIVSGILTLVNESRGNKEGGIVAFKEGQCTRITQKDLNNKEQ